jgi:uncharacterized coiled-coil DUF342 family protein
VSEYADVVVQEDSVKELEPEIKAQIKLFKMKIVELNGEIDTLYEELAKLFRE